MIHYDTHRLTTFARRPAGALTVVEVVIVARWTLDLAYALPDADAEAADIRADLDSRRRALREWLGRYMNHRVLAEAISVPPTPPDLAHYLALVFSDDPYLLDVDVIIGDTAATVSRAELTP